MSFNDHRANAVRQSIYGKEMREPVAKSCEMIRDNRLRRVNAIDQIHKQRVNSATVTKLSGNNEYYQLILTRANRQ